MRIVSLLLFPLKIPRPAVTSPVCSRAPLHFNSIIIVAAFSDSKKLKMKKSMSEISMAVAITALFIEM